MRAFLVSLGVVGVVMSFLAFAVGVSAVVGLVVELLWNYVVAGIHHNELHVGFLTAWAATFLFGILTKSFRITITKKE